MNMTEKRSPIRVLLLIASPKLAEKATDMFHKGAIQIQYQWNAAGTAPNEIIDILGLGNPEKKILISAMPKPFADKMLIKLKEELGLGSVNSGIAFTRPLSGANAQILHMLEQLKIVEKEVSERKDETTMPEPKYTLITVVMNQGFSEEAMDAAREAGAGGGTVVQSRRVGSKETMNFWGMNLQEEKEMLFIVAESENKLKIMQAIGEKFGIHSEAQGLVLSLPIDTVIGLENK